MKALGVVSGCLEDAATPPDSAVVILTFCATDDPRQGSCMVTVSLAQPEDQIIAALKQGLVDFINAQRGSAVITAADVRIP